MFGFIKNFLMVSAILSSLVCTTTLSPKNGDEYSSCVLYIVLLSIFFAINVGIAIYLFTINT